MQTPAPKKLEKRKNFKDLTFYEYLKKIAEFDRVKNYNCYFPHNNITKIVKELKHRQKYLITFIIIEDSNDRITLIFKRIAIISRCYKPIFRRIISFLKILYYEIEKKTPLNISI